MINSWERADTRQREKYRVITAATMLLAIGWWACTSFGGRAWAADNIDGPAVPSPSLKQGEQVGQVGEAVAPVTLEQIRKSAAEAAASPQFGAVPLGEEFDHSQSRTANVRPTGTAGNVSAEPVPELSESTTKAPELGVNFNGIPSTGFRPADPHLAVGPNHIVQVVNASLRISNKSGGTIGTNTLEGIFGKPSGSVFLFDPWVEYDHFANRFVVVSIATNGAKTDSWFIVAVTKTATPGTSGGSWWTYYLRSDIDFPSTDTALWGDYQKLGFDNTYFYISANFFNSSGVFQYCKVRRYGKSEFYSGGSVTGNEWRDVRDPFGNRVYSIQPAVTFGAPGTEYLASSTSGAGSSIVVFRIPQGGTSLFSNTIATNSWAVPDDAVQKGSSTRIDAGDCRLLNAVYRGSRLYTCHTVKRGTFPCACHYIGVNTTNLTKSLDVTIGFGGNSSLPPYFYSRPAIAVSGGGNLGTVFNFSASDRYGGAFYTQINLNGSIQPLALLKEGENAYVSLVGSRNRWGDYNGICVDPSNTGRLWFNSMWATSTANTWGTYVGSTALTASSPTSRVQADYEPANQTLTLTGDDAANSVLVRSVGSQVIVIGQGGTLINGQPIVVLSAAPRFSLQTNLASGDDRLLLIGLDLQSATVAMGEGNDAVWMLLSSVVDLRADGGDGTDALVTTSSHVEHSDAASFP